MTQPGLSTIAPGDLLHTGGFLGARFHANRNKRLKDRTLSEEFIRLHERKNHDDWFWMGEQIGKWLDAATYAGLIAGDQELLDRVHELIDRLAASQEANGYLGITSRYHRNPARGMELYEMYYVLLGLLVCSDLLGSDTALKTAERLGDFIIQTWGTEPGQFPLVGPFPGNGHDGGEGTLILEPIVLLSGRTGQERFVRWGEATLAKWDEWWDAYPQANHSCGYTAMRAFAAGEKDVHDLRENMHAHTFHMTLLGIAALYNVTGKGEYRDVVSGSVDRLADEWIFLTGGMSSTERYVPRQYYHTRNQIEVCPQHTWLLLLDQMLQWSGAPRYAAEIERDLFNHFLAAQLADGSNWSYFTPLNGHAQEPSHPNCCNAAGHRIAGRMPTYLYGLRAKAPAVLLYSESGGVLRPEGLPAVTLRQETTFPADGAVTIQVDPEMAASFPLHLRIPPYAAGATARVGEDVFHAEEGEFLVIDRRWIPGDRVELSLPFAVACQADANVAAITRGPLTYAYFQDAQADPMVFHWRRGLYPEDVVLALDPSDPAQKVTEEAVADGLLGPALHLPAQIKSRAPIFSTATANSKLPQPQIQTVRLLPFVNQGAVRGEYQVFLDYRHDL